MKTVVGTGMLLLLMLTPAPGAQATVKRTGILRETIADDFSREESTTRYSLRFAHGTTRILPTSLYAVSAGDRVVVSGTMRGDELVGSVRPAGSPALPDEPALTEQRKIAVLLARFPEDPAEPWPLEDTRETVFTGEKSAREFYLEESYRQIELTGKNSPEGDVFGWFTLDKPKPEKCDASLDGAVRAIAEEEDPSFSSEGYDTIIYYYPRLNCSWGGITNAIGGNTVTINGTNGNRGLLVVAHEIGHTLDLFHAGGLKCTENGFRVPISNSCEVIQYADPFDVMGGGKARHSNTWHLMKLGLLEPPNIETITTGGIYSLTAALEPSLDPVLLRIPRVRSEAGTVTSWYTLEVRKQGGIFEDVSDRSMTGVSIRETAIGNAPADTALIDCNPELPTPGWSLAEYSPCTPGQTIEDESVRITTLSAGSGTASVSVTFLGEGDHDAPSAPANLSASQETADVELRWDASTDNVGVSRYAVFRDGAEIGTTPDTEFTDPAATLGQHAYVVYAEDEAGNRSTASASRTITVTAFAPGVENDAVGPVIRTAAVLRGQVDNNRAPDGSACRFQVVLKSAPATPIDEPPCEPSPVAGNVSTPVRATATGLSPGTEYFYRVVAENEAGASTGSPDAPFTTAAAAEEEGVPLSVVLEGTGTGVVTSSPGLIFCSPFCADEMAEGAKVTLTASPESGSQFMAWRHCDKGGIVGRQCTVTMSQAKEVSAVFSVTHSLTVAKAEGSGPGKAQSKPGGVLCLYNCTQATASFREGKAVQVLATPAKHFHLAAWGGDCSGSGACEVVMGEDHLVSADFEEDPHYPLTLYKSGADQGIVKSHPAGILCSYTCNEVSASFYEGEEVLLEVAKVGKGSAFEGWSGGGCSGTGTCTVTMSAAQEVTAELE